MQDLGPWRLATGEPKERQKERLDPGGSCYGLLRAELETRGKSLAPMDLLIATHALAENCTLVSADAAFVHVPDLKHIDWTTVQTGSGIT